MVITNHIILGKLRTQIERVSVRYAEYARRYETFRALPICENGNDRELQLNIAYLYHTSLSILEERQQSLNDYCDDVRDVLASVEEISGAQEQDELRENLFSECGQEIISVKKDLRQIDKGIKAAKQHERELLME